MRDAAAAISTGGVVDATDGAQLDITAVVGAVLEGAVRIDLTVKHGETTVLGKAQLTVRTDA